MPEYSSMVGLEGVQYAPLKKKTACGLPARLSTIHMQ